MKESLEGKLRRLTSEREEADRRYNDALTAVDRSLPKRPELRDPLPPVDEHQLRTLNEAWNTLPQPPSLRPGIRGRLGRFVWGLIGPYLQRQLTFNSVVVDHINRSVEAQKAAHAREMEAIADLRWYMEATTIFHTHLVMYMQQVTAYVDTKNREERAGALVLNAALDGLADAQLKYAESLSAREQRYEARVNALNAASADLRTSVGVLQQAVAGLKSQVASGLSVQPGVPLAPAEVRSTSDAFSHAADAAKYVGFENEFRGPQSDIRARQESYLPYFEGVEGDVLDVGCGRGEFIELLTAHGVRAHGIDVNSAMVDVCRQRGLDAVQVDAVTHLSRLPDDSLAGLFAAQVVEHLEPAYLLRFLDLAQAKLRPGGRLVLETINPACWTAFFDSYIRDITHRWPLHPDTLRYFVLASGFTSAAVEFRSPVPAEIRLEGASVRTDASEDIRALAEALNRNAERLNARMFTHLDYAVVAQKGHTRP
jgi:2-polyprenyl-3-methyl-5-hydroxy-6-metoxy-1,4-benzoquinol methylase